MEQHKIKNFEQENPNVQFPNFTHLDAAVADVLRARLSSKLGVSADDGVALVNAIESQATAIPRVDASAPDFRLDALLQKELGVPRSAAVLLNWYRFDDVDEMNVGDVADHFDSIWYPSVDDLDLLDPACTWLVSIAHHGTVSITKF